LKVDMFFCGRNVFMNELERWTCYNKMEEYALCKRNNYAGQPTQPRARDWNAERICVSQDLVRRRISRPYDGATMCGDDKARPIL
jgi:hypothetical protein